MEDFDFWQSGALLALNTFGSFLTYGLALPLVCLPSPPQHQGAASASPAAADGAALPADDDAGASQRQAQQQPQSDQVPTERTHWQTAEESEPSRFQWDLRAAALMFMTAATLNAVVAMASAAVQRRHLMVWALFAPKFLFDACILLVCDAAVLAGVAVALLICQETMTDSGTILAIN